MLLLGKAVKTLDRDLDVLGCVVTAARETEACHTAVEDFLGFHRGNVNGIRVSIPGQSPWRRHQAGHRLDAEADETYPVAGVPLSDAYLREVEDKLDELERAPGPARMHPVRTADWILVTSRPIAPSGRLTVWGTFATLRGELEESGGRVGRVTLVGPNGDPLDSVKFSRRKGPSQMPDRAALAAWIRAGAKGPVPVDGSLYAGRYTAMSGTSLGVLSLTSLDDSSRAKMVNVLGVQIVLMIAGLIVAIILTDGTMKRLRRLRAAADEIGSGNLEAEIRVTGRDEIGRLADRFRVMATQLLSNAIKFTPEGGRVAVRTRLGDGVVRVTVSDTGIGIAEVDHAAVFEEFRQVGTSEARRQGTGLGLALSRKFIALHGGTVGLVSRLGEGSTFTFEVPINSGGG